jgi:hypothetical protein
MSNDDASGDSPTLTKKKTSKTGTPVLDNFCTDLTEKARKGELDPVVGRDKEMERVAQLLLSPVAFIEDGGLCRRVEVESHDVVFDSKGKLHTIMLDINEKWEGGGVVW